MTDVIGAISQLVTAFLSWLGDMLTFINGEPLLLVFVLLAVINIVLRYLKHWLPGF